MVASRSSLNPIDRKTWCAEFRALLDLDGDIPTRYDDAVAAYIFHSRRGESLAAAKIEFCAVPGTDHASVAHNAFTERAAIVRAVVVDRMDRSANVKHRYGPASDLNLTRAAKRKMFCLCDFMEGHNRFLNSVYVWGCELQSASWAQDRLPTFNGPLNDVGCLRETLGTSDLGPPLLRPGAVARLA